MLRETEYSQTIEDAVLEVSKALLGKEHQIRLALCCLLSGGHLLIEDLPGMGKTTLSHALASVLGLEFKRIQFTSDLLPADILGVSIFDQTTAEFSFHSGPIFSQLVLADEVNRTTPKTQSALLEAMEEGQVTVARANAHVAANTHATASPPLASNTVAYTSTCVFSNLSTMTLDRSASRTVPARLFSVAPLPPSPRPPLPAVFPANGAACTSTSSAPRSTRAGASPPRCCRGPYTAHDTLVSPSST